MRQLLAPDTTSSTAATQYDNTDGDGRFGGGGGGGSDGVDGGGGGGVARVKLSQLEANANDYYWVSPRIIVACTAAAVSVTCIAIKTGIILWRDFSTGFISCMLSVTLVQGGIGGTDDAY